MKALVLSGGNIKGAYQAGAIAQVLESGWIPDVVTGISVGALNAAFLAAVEPLNPTNTGARLEAFWRERITSPKVAVKKRGILELAWRVLTDKWDGVVSTAPLEALVRSSLVPGARRTDLQVWVGASNLTTGGLEYHESREPVFLDAVLASTAEPVVMPMRYIGGRNPCYDGGLRDIAPLKGAIELGATEVIAILCQPEHETLPPLAAGKVLDLIDHAMSIVTNEIITNDIEIFKSVNDLVQSAPAAVPGKRFIPLTVIRPAQALGASVTAFTTADISRMLEQGRADAKAALALPASKA